MEQFETQQQVLKQKKKWNWKKIVVLAGAGAFVITSTSLVTWGVTKSYLDNKNNGGIDTSNLPQISYQSMNLEQFNKINTNFYKIKNLFIKKLATEQLLFYLSSPVFGELKSEVMPSFSQINQQNYQIAPNLQKILGTKILNTVGSNLRVWGLNKDYTFNPKLAEISFSKLELQDKKIKFESSLGYQGSKKTFIVKGVFADSEYKTFPISEFNKDNVERIFTQANKLFSSEINRNGYFVGLDFQGAKTYDQSRRWVSDQTVNLQEFNSQVWDYVLNSLKNFNLVQENVFVDASKLFLIDGWNRDKIYVKNKDKVKVNESKNEIWIGKENDFGPHSIVSKILVSWKTDQTINFEFWGSYLQDNQWGNY